jgi:hypothetical protein
MLVMIVNRRKLIGSLFAAPTIVAVNNIMPIKSFVLSPPVEETWELQIVATLFDRLPVPMLRWINKKKGLITPIFLRHPEHGLPSPRNFETLFPLNGDPFPWMATR